VVAERDQERIANVEHPPFDCNPIFVDVYHKVSVSDLCKLIDLLIASPTKKRYEVSLVPKSNECRNANKGVVSNESYHTVLAASFLEMGS
jgi:hypothetical protein